MNYCELPPEFSGLLGRVNYVHQVSPNEYHSSCPNCGGEMHENGTPPDRFVMWIVSRSGTPFGMCLRGHCNWKWSPLKEDANWTPEERQAAAEKRAEIDARREAKIKQVAQTVMEHAYYVRCFDDLRQDTNALEYWEKTRGIPMEWINWLRLGVWHDYRVNGRNSVYHSEAYTIPVWTYGTIAENVKIRVANPIDDNDRYRNLYKSGAQHLYAPRHDLSGVGNINIAVEGEIKSATVQIYADLPDSIRIQGWQSKSPEPRIYRMYKNAELVYLALDPDAYRPDNAGNVAINRVVRSLGAERVRLILPPHDQKFDDAILQGYNFRNALNMAIRPEKWKYWGIQ